MNLIILAFILFSATGFACEVMLPAQLIVLGDGAASANAFQSKDCTENTLSDLHQTLLDVDGKISSLQLQEMMTAKGHEVTIQPFSLQVKNLKTLIREQLILPPGVHVKATRPMGTAQFLALSPGDRVDVSCSSCLFGSQQVMNLTVQGFDGTKSSLIAFADFRTMVRAFRLTTSLSSFSEMVNTNYLKEEYVEAIPHTDLVTNLDTLKFYKTNKPLKAGELLRQSDLNAVNLVRAGLKTEVILENQAVRIKTQGISRSNGSLGELVEVYHPQKNKKYQGKVIDINKVLVEL